MTSCNQGIGSRLNNRIAVFSGIICCVTTLYYHSGEGGATPERTFSNACYGVGDSDGSEGVATTERTVSNACYGVGEDYGGKGGAPSERTVSNACYGVCFVLVGNGFVDSGCGKTTVVHGNWKAVFLKSYLHGICARDVVVEVAGLEVEGVSTEGGQ